MLGRVDLTQLYVAIDGKTYENLAAAKKAGAAVITYGNFLNIVIQFLIVAFVIFMIVKQINRMTRTAAGDLPK